MIAAPVEGFFQFEGPATAFSKGGRGTVALEEDEEGETKGERLEVGTIRGADSTGVGTTSEGKSSAEREEEGRRDDVARWDRC